MSEFPQVRPPAGRRNSSSPVVEETIREVSADMKDRELAWVFGNCLPNTLDTTVQHRTDAHGQPDTFVITGDIPAMWLRDSTNQVWPYLPMLSRDPGLRRLVAGVVRRQTQCTLLDPYANAFCADPAGRSEHEADLTEMRPGVFERKYELDSLCAALRLACGYHAATGDVEVFDTDWRSAVGLILATITTQQAGLDEPGYDAYRFARWQDNMIESVPFGRGHPAARTGMSKSPFRPSDDGALLPFLIPANAMAVVCLRRTAALLRVVGGLEALADRAETLAQEIAAAIAGSGIVHHREAGDIYAYEVDGYGSHYLMDDANVPSLLSLPYLGFVSGDDPLYQRTRSFVLSHRNPYYFEGAAARGVGGPHIGQGYIWPIALMLQAMTSRDDGELCDCLRLLKRSHAGTGFMHEAFWKDDPTRFTRAWFAWANTLFGELILWVHRERPGLLEQMTF